MTIYLGPQAITSQEIRSVQIANQVNYLIQGNNNDYQVFRPLG